MNSRRAKRLRKMARVAVDQSMSTMAPDGRSRIAARLYRAVRRHWYRLNHRERGRFGVPDVVRGFLSGVK